MRKEIAALTSNILNPFLVSLGVVLLLSFVSTASTLEALKWALIIVMLCILPVFLVVVAWVRSGRLDAIFTSARGQRTRIYLLAGLFAVLGLAILIYLGAPPILVATFIGGLSLTLIFMCINLWWKISLHTALVSASATVLVILYGWMAAVTVAFVPLMAWSRIELEYHSFAQAVTGALLAALIVLVVLRPFLLG